MKKTFLLELLISALLTPLTAFAATSHQSQQHTSHPVRLKPFDASYTLKASNIPLEGSAESKLVKTGNDQWTLSFHANALIMSYTETSQFIYNKHQKIQPVSYEMKQSTFGSETTNHIQFNWITSKAIYHREKKQSTITLTPNSLDDMSYQAQLRLDLLQNKPSLTYTLVEKHKLETLKFKRDGEEPLKTPLGVIQTVRLKTVRDNNKRETWIWLAPKWQYLPVKIKQRTGSQTFQAEITKATVAGKSLNPPAEPKTTTNPKERS